MSKSKKPYRLLKREPMMLPVLLAPEEVMSAAKRIGAITDEQDQLNSQVDGLKAQIKEKNSRFDSLNEELRHCARMVRKGEEDREIMVHHEAHMDKGVVQAVRQDTFEIVGERQMTNDERQGVLFSDQEQPPPADEQGEHDLSPLTEEEQARQLAERDELSTAKPPRKRSKLKAVDPDDPGDEGGEEPEP